MAHAVSSFLMKAAAGISAVLASYRELVAENRQRKIRFEAEMYGGRYKHASKNDDDLPIAHEPLPSRKPLDDARAAARRTEA